METTLKDVKGTNLRTPDFIRDSIQSIRGDKTTNDMPQSPAEADHIISILTFKNDVVLDPMMGSGTTGIAALKENRQFIGIDNNPQTFEIAQMNISKSTAALN